MPARPARRRRSAPARPAGRRASRGTLRIRWAAPSDVDLLVDHRHRMWREIRRFRPGEIDRHDVQYRRWLLGQRSRGRFSAVIVEDEGGRPVGSGGLWRMPWIPRPGPLGRGEMPYILSMYTVPRHRGRGVATLIVGALVGRARELGFGRVVLHASRFGRSLYERLGFEAANEMRLAIRPARRARSRSARR